MTITQRSTWVQLIVMPLVTIVYFTVVITRAADRPIEAVSWIVPLIWAIGTVIVGIIAGTIVTAIAHGVRSSAKGEKPEFEEGDVRDKQIEDVGTLKSQWINGLGTLAVIILAMSRVDHFWIANAMFLAGMLSGVRGGFAKLRAYREGF